MSQRMIVGIARADRGSRARKARFGWLAALEARTAGLSGHSPRSARVRFGRLLAAALATALVLNAWEGEVGADPQVANPILFVKRPPVGRVFFGPFFGALSTVAFPPGFVHEGGANVHRLDPDGTVRALTQRSAAAIQGLEVSWNGTRVLFSMRDGDDATWQLWEMDVDGSDQRRISPDARFNDRDPAYLPDGRIVFTSDRQRMLDPYTSLPSAQLHVMNADGTGVRQLSSNPGGESAPSVMASGEIAFVRWDVKTSGPRLIQRIDTSRFQLWKMNPDGTNDGHPLFGPHTLDDFEGGYLGARDGGDGRFVATLTPDPFFAAAGAVVRLDPHGDKDAHAPVFLAGEDAATDFGAARRFRDAYPLADGRVLVSFADAGAGHGGGFPTASALLAGPLGSFALATLPAEGGPPTVLYDDPHTDEVEAVEVVARTVPPVLAESLDPGHAAWGVLNAQDLVLRGRNQEVGAPDFQRAIPDEPGLKVRLYRGAVGGDVFGRFPGYGRVNPVLQGDAPMRPDGSFAAKIPANVPIVWEVRDAAGRMLVKERFWNQVLPGQTQTCAGCHSPHDGSVGRTSNDALAAPTDLLAKDPAAQMAQAALAAAQSVLDDLRLRVVELAVAGRGTKRVQKKADRAARLLEHAGLRLAAGRASGAVRKAEQAGARALRARRKALSLLAD